MTTALTQARTLQRMIDKTARISELEAEIVGLKAQLIVARKTEGVGLRCLRCGGQLTGVVDTLVCVKCKAVWRAKRGSLLKRVNFNGRV